MTQIGKNKKPREPKDATSLLINIRSGGLDKNLFAFGNWPFEKNGVIATLGDIFTLGDIATWNDIATFGDIETRKKFF